MATTTNTRNYSSIYNIKDFVRNSIIPKYFDMTKISDMNMGLMGVTVDLATTTAEDTFNVVTTMIKEMFPNTAELPESIYSYAALFQLDEMFATPASLESILLIREDDIINFAEIENNNTIFTLDRALVIDIKGIQYALDYDVKILVKKYKGDYIFTCRYDTAFTNSLNANNTAPYIKHTRFDAGEENGGKYLGLMVKLHQVTEMQYEEIIVSNSVLNNPKIEIEYDGQLANFEAFYKAPDSNEFVQLEKRLKNSTDSSSPFCFYTFRDDKTLEISFSTKYGAFKPDFNSTIRVNYYTTLGSEGNFDKYTGNTDEIICTPYSDVYSYNNSLNLHCVPQTASIGGVDTLSLSALKNLVNEKFSTINTVTTENDLVLYFNNTKYRTGTDVLFLKKRDDVFERLFTSYNLFKDSNEEIFYTNTLDTIINLTDIEETTDFYLIKPGRLFTYYDDSVDTAILQPDYIDAVAKTATAKELRDKNNFRYSNPYLITIHRGNVDNVGFFLNSINQDSYVNYTYINNSSPNQFICNTVHLERNAIYGENKNRYTFTIELMCASDPTEPLFDEDGMWLDKLKVKNFFTNKEGNEICYMNLDYKSYDEETKIYTFEGYITTDDTVSLSGTMKVENVYDIITNELTPTLIPYINQKMVIGSFFVNSEGLENTNRYRDIPDVADYLNTNIYSTIDDPITLLYPFDIIRSQMEYIELGEEGSGQFAAKLKFVPLVFMDDLLITNKYNDLLSRLVNQYKFLNEILTVLENNYSIDMKFFNTYGRARIITNDYYDLLDRVNCSITMDLALYAGTDSDTILTNVRSYISSFVDSLNISGDTSIKISNLIQEIENEFAEIDYLKFRSINEYGSDIQVLRNVVVDPTTMGKEQIMKFVPEFVSMRKDDIILNLITD